MLYLENTTYDNLSWSGLGLGLVLGLGGKFSLGAIVLEPATSETKYLRMDQVKFAEDSL